MRQAREDPSHSKFSEEEEHQIKKQHRAKDLIDLRNAPPVVKDDGTTHMWSMQDIKRGYPVVSEGTGVGQLFQGFKNNVTRGNPLRTNSTWNNPAFKIMAYNEQRWLDGLSSFGRQATLGGFHEGVDDKLTSIDQTTLARMKEAREGEIGVPCEKE